MKPSASFTCLLVTEDRVARADFAPDLRMARSAQRPMGSSLGEAVKVAASLGSKPAQPIWVLTAEVWTQQVKLSPAQIRGLTRDQLESALSFEAEPFSGISAIEGATGFQDLGGGAFAVAQIPRSDRDGILHALKTVGAKPLGIAHPGIVPEGDEALLEWWPRLAANLSSQPFIAPPAPEPSPHRFLVAGIATAAVASGLLVAMGLWNSLQRAGYEKQLTQLTAASRSLDNLNKQNEALRKQLAALDQLDRQRDQIRNRRSALRALLAALAATRPEDIVVRSLTAEGTSTIVVAGIALEAEAVDELGIVLSKRLADAGWTAQPRNKIGRRRTSNGGPWEFTLAVSLSEETNGTPVQVSYQRVP